MAGAGKLADPDAYLYASVNPMSPPALRHDSPLYPIYGLYRARKNPFALACMMGLDTIFALLTGRASIAQLERRARRLLGVEARALISPDAAIAADVDRPAHVPGTSSDRLPAPAGQPGGQAGSFVAAPHPVRSAT